MNVLVYLLRWRWDLALRDCSRSCGRCELGQYDDLDGAALRILGDEDLKGEKRHAPETAQSAVFTRRPSER